MKVIAVIPAFNEARVIQEVLEKIKPHVNEVVLVDDGSKDSTKHLAKQAGVIAVSHIINRGQGAALQTGVELALKRKADVIVHIDSDGQHPAEQIPEMIQPLVAGEADIVLGSRFLNEESNVPPIRKAVLKAALVFTKVMSGLQITDPQSGFRAMTPEAAKLLELRQDRMAHASELLQLVARHELRYKEVPVKITYTDYSLEKGQSSWGAIKIVVDLIKGSLL